MTDETPKKKRRRWLWITLLVVVAGGMYLYWPVDESIRVSPQTTVIEGPLNPDGTVNYVEAMDSSCAEGVTRENNAAIPLIQTLGPESLSSRIRGKVTAALGVKFDSQAPRYVEWDDWIASHATPPEASQSRPAGETPATQAQVGEGDGSAETQPEEGDFVELPHPPWLYEVMEELYAGGSDPQLEQWLQANKEPLDRIVAAAQLPRYYMPLVSASDPPQVIDTITAEFRRYREAAMALAARAELKARAGQIESAWQDVLAIHRLGRLVSQGPFLLEQIIGVSMERIAARPAASLATSDRCTAELAKKMLADLAALPPVGNAVGSIDRGERFLMLDYVMMWHRGGDMGSEGLNTGLVRLANVDYNEVLITCNALYDRMVAAAGIEDPSARELAVRATNEAIEAELHTSSPAATVAKFVALLAGGRATRTARSRAFAKIYAGIMMPSLGRAVEIQDAARMGTEIEKVSFALAAYRAEKGRWPDKLEKLTPGYLAELPPDRFAGAPLIYRLTDKGYILYSVGDNKRDDGGVNDRKQDKDDIVVEAK